jgi:hypothetical protein
MEEIVKRLKELNEIPKKAKLIEYKEEGNYYHLRFDSGQYKIKIEIIK